MPRRSLYQLLWSLAEQKYVVLYEGRPVTPQIEPASQGWFDWLEMISSFSFQSHSGQVYTVRKEGVQRGGVYWYAYRRQAQRMQKRYLARGTDLTLEHLEVMVATFEQAQISAFVPDVSSREALAAFDLEQAEKKYSLPHGIDHVFIPAQLLLAAKLHIPRLPGQHVLRSRLLSLMQQGVRRKLTLIAAPAGSGKTTLLAEWTATTDLPVAWISLDVADNDPMHFLSYLVTALVSLDTHLDVATYLSGATQDVEAILTMLLNDLLNHLQQETVLILDDYHALSGDAIHALTRFLFDHLPPRLHLVIGTRVDPPLPLARLRAQAQLLEIRSNELRFAPDEIKALVSHMELVLSEEATILLEQRTEGWIAGVQLLTLVLRDKSDALSFLQTFRGTHRFLVEYVGEEILAQQPFATQRFLLHTSILTRMTASLCDAVTGQGDGEAQLAYLLHANLFVSALDDADIWYRYHSLFAETLRAHLQKQEPELLSALYLRASLWYELHHDEEVACDYALLAGDFSRAAQLLSRLFPRLVEQGRFRQLGRWLSQLPPALVISSPQLSIAAPWMDSFGQGTSNYMSQVLQYIELSVRNSEQNESTSWTESQSVLSLFHAFSETPHDNLAHAFSLVRQTLQKLTALQTPLSQLIARFLQIALGVMHGVSGNIGTAEQVLFDLSRMRSGEPFSVVRLSSLFLLGELYRARGELCDAHEFYQSYTGDLETYAGIPPMPLLVIGFSLFRKASILYEWNRLEEAASDIQLVSTILPGAIDEITPLPSRSHLIYIFLWAQTRVQWAQGHSVSTCYLFELADKQPEILCDKPVQGKQRPVVSIAVLIARLALLCGRVEIALRWEQSCGCYFDEVPTTLQDGSQIYAYLTLARILIARGRDQRDKQALAQAMFLLENWRNLAQRLNFQGWLIEIHMLKVLALQAQGDLEQALTLLGAILAQAEPQRAIRLFADEGQPMCELLAAVAPYTTASTRYIQRILEALPAVSTAVLVKSAQIKEIPLLDPLSEREQEVLALLAQGLSNQQIADQLVISLHTAKRHVKHILAKLNVHSRLEAVARARDLHLSE